MAHVRWQERDLLAQLFVDQGQLPVEQHEDVHSFLVKGAFDGLGERGRRPGGMGASGSEGMELLSLSLPPSFCFLPLVSGPPSTTEAGSS